MILCACDFQDLFRPIRYNGGVISRSNWARFDRAYFSHQFHGRAPHVDCRAGAFNEVGAMNRTQRLNPIVLSLVAGLVAAFAATYSVGGDRGSPMNPSALAADLESSALPSSCTRCVWDYRNLPLPFSSPVEVVPQGISGVVHLVRAQAVIAEVFDGPPSNGQRVFTLNQPAPGDWPGTILDVRFNNGLFVEKISGSSTTELFVSYKLDTPIPSSIPPD
jgi:hypothetical protein